MRARAKAVWQAPTLGAVPVAPGELGSHVAATLGVPTEPMAELVVLYLVALDASLAEGLPRLLADQLEWQQTRLRTLAPQLGPGQVVAAVREELAAVLSLEALGRLDRHVADAWPFVGVETEEPPPELTGVARTYLDRLLAGDRRGAVDVVTAAVAAGTGVTEMLLQVFQPVQIEVGRLWEQGRVSVAQEHFSTAVTQLAMSVLYPQLFAGAATAATGHTLVAVSAGVEAHEVGLRIVTDLLEAAGWRTTYLGSSVPVQDVVDQVADQRAAVVAVSGTMAGHVRHVRDLVEALRADPRTSGVKVVVGGRAFQLSPELVEAVGADGWARDGAEVVAVCNRLMEVDRAVG